MEAVGILEVFGLTAGFVAADAGCKAANADKLPVPLLVSIKFRGSVEDVKAAMEAGVAAANKISGVYSQHIIARPEEDTEKMLDISCLGKYKPMET